MAICRYDKKCNWYIYPTIINNKKQFVINHIKNQEGIICNLKDLKSLVKEISEDIKRYE